LSYALKEGEAFIHIDNQEAGIIQLATFMEKLHSKWKPHAGQIPMGWALFYGGFKDIFACCGRNFGKTESIAYLETRYANENPKSENYIFGPLAKQVREILWASNRIQEMSPEEFKEATHSVEMRVTFTNKSFIKLDGSDNVDSYRGIKPKGLSVYDEFKDMRPDFISAYDPNRAAFDSPAIYIGTPPEFHNHFVDYMERAKKGHGKDWYFIHAPTSANPYISRAWLEKKKRELIEAGDEESWLREYEAIFVKGGKRHIIPQALKYTPIPFSMDLFKDPKEWKVHVRFDPGSSSTFAVLFVAFHPYTRRSICIREIYEQELSKMTTRQIWARVFEIQAELIKLGFPKHDTFEFGYDEAAAWFRNETNEIRECKEVWLAPTSKASNSKEDGISILRDVFNKSLLDICDSCPKTYWELENYMKDENGKIPKLNDHQIDNLRYYFAEIGYNLNEATPPRETDPTTQKRAFKIEDDFEESASLSDIDDEFNHTGEFL
jgi:hypothetical protein